mgnify:CR=1 FL=1
MARIFMDLLRESDSAEKDHTIIVMYLYDLSLRTL